MPKAFNETLLNTVATLRKKASLSQQELADMVDVSRQTIVAIEKGNYSPSVLLALKISKALATPLEDIFTYRS